MNTEQNYSAQVDCAINSELAAKNVAQSISSPDNKQSSSQVDLSLCVWEYADRRSETDIVYWALEAAKQKSLKGLQSAIEGSDEFEEHDYHTSKIQEIQNTLFDSVCNLASRLSLQVNGMDHK